MKQQLFAHIEANKATAFDMAWQIFDNPEIGTQEFFACKLLTDRLKELGFETEIGVYGEETGFRAVWKQGEGGPVIGILGEYDALRQQGHACGHHMQTPAAIAAFHALKDLVSQTGQPCTLVLYGTPAEENGGGKIRMIDKGAFRDLDVAMVTHATGKQSYIASGSKALNSFFVNFHGKAAHASGAPHMGRSAADAMFLAFQGVEFMREHVKDDVRMHYTVMEGLGPSNVVCPLAKASFTVRCNDNRDLPDLAARMKKIFEGACLMTETTHEIIPKLPYLARVPNHVLTNVAVENFRLIGCNVAPEILRPTNGSTDVGNVSLVVPTLNISVEYYDAPGHSEAWLEHGKSEWAENCLLRSAKMLASTAYDLICNPELVRKAQEEFRETMGN